MPKSSKSSLQDALASRSPMGQRQAITPVNILEEALHPAGLANEESARENRSEESSTIDERNERTEKAHAQSARAKRTVKSNKKSVRSKRTDKASATTERKKRMILMEPDKPQTIRDSYEAYVDQLAEIEELQELYRKKTGRPLSKSRFIREAIAAFLPRAFAVYREESAHE